MEAKAIREKAAPMDHCLQTLRGGSDFTYRSGYIEHLCECHCNGTYTCEEAINFCEEDKATRPIGNWRLCC